MFHALCYIVSCISYNMIYRVALSIQINYLMEQKCHDTFLNDSLQTKAVRISTIIETIFLQWMC